MRAVSRIYRSFFFSAVERYGSLIIQLASIAALSRLLTPAEFGIYALIAALTALAHTLREFGCTNYLIQKINLSERCIRSAFTVTFCISCLLVIILLSLRDAAAMFFSEPGLRQGISLSAVNFLVLPFSMTITALLRRDLAFDTIASCNLAANFVIAVTSVGLAALGLSYMGPVWGSVAGNVTLVVLLFVYRPDIRIFRFSLHNWRDVTGFGLYSSGTSIINTAYAWSPQMILARVLDMAAVGLYSRAFSVIQLFDKLVLDAVHPVIMPLLSAQAKEGADLKRVYLRSVELISVLHWPFFICVALLADPIVRILFGGQWIEAVPLVRMLAVATLSLFAACLTFPILVSIGHVRDTLTASLISVPPSLLVMLIASFFGIQAVAASAFLTLPLQAAVAYHFVCRRIGLGITDLAGALRKSAIVAAFTTSGPLLILGINDFSLTISVSRFVAAAFLALIGWCLGLVITRHPLLTQLRLALDQYRAGRWLELRGVHLLRRRVKAA